ncbi:hypothetical protein N7925_18400 [Streptomyces sp. CA-278952]|uniref:hypothetical protein n=1 Tax=Streptomyces sp. CA-278952 TaxID=2980556 RepID=UPI00236749E9|nr:hypothetical protein [Streptomyces sp. CA-278952]WDG30173.1 hypothetical protein N7925_18400 [Streptomyces sp. CA-278952]
MAEQGAAESTLLRGTAIFAASVTVVLYLFGLLLVGLTVSEVGSGTNSTPMHQCVYAPNVPEGTHVETHEVSYLPVHILCRTTDGGEFTSRVVPSWLNPTLAVSFAATVALTATAFVQADRRAAARQAG